MTKKMERIPTTMTVPQYDLMSHRTKSDPRVAKLEKWLKKTIACSPYNIYYEEFLEQIKKVKKESK